MEIESVFDFSHDSKERTRTLESTLGKSSGMPMARNDSSGGRRGVCRTQGREGEVTGVQVHI
jgi:hypothetical protein